MILMKRDVDFFSPPPFPSSVSFSRFVSEDKLYIYIYDKKSREVSKRISVYVQFNDQLFCNN